jgi:2,6-dihydroxypseudooxynicotine hydrolase
MAYRPPGARRSGAGVAHSHIINEPGVGDAAAEGDSVSRQRVLEVIDPGIHRFLGDGVHYRDLMDLRDRIGQWSQWCGAWIEAGSQAEARGDAALAAGAQRTGARELARAALYYHYAQNLYYDDARQKRDAHDRKVAVFARAAARLDPPLVPVSIPWAGGSLPAYLRLPRGVERPACVILLGGLDTTKEDYMVVNDLCVERGLATIAFDGPGQGELLFTHRWPRDFERSVVAVVDFLERCPDVDARRIGIIGRSTGGYYAPRAAALDDRIRAAVSWGAMAHLRNMAEIPRVTLDGFIYVSGTRSAEEAREYFSCIDLEATGSRIRCPLLVVHGGRDTITPMDNATLMMAAAAGPLETLIWEDSGHCCHDRSHIVRPAMADFMVRRLQ